MFIQTQDTLRFLVTIKDKVNSSGGDSGNDNLVQEPITVIVSDENDNSPEFQNVPYEAEVLEDAQPGTTVFSKILVTDKDTVGEILDITCNPDDPDVETCTKYERGLFFFFLGVTRI